MHRKEYLDQCGPLEWRASDSWQPVGAGKPELLQWCERRLAAALLYVTDQPLEQSRETQTHPRNHLNFDKLMTNSLFSSFFCKLVDLSSSNLKVTIYEILLNLRMNNNIPDILAPYVHISVSPHTDRINLSMSVSVLSDKPGSGSTCEQEQHGVVLPVDSLHSLHAQTAIDVLSRNHCQASCHRPDAVFSQEIFFNEA